MKMNKTLTKQKIYDIILMKDKNLNILSPWTSNPLLYIIHDFYIFINNLVVNRQSSATDTSLGDSGNFLLNPPILCLMFLMTFDADTMQMAGQTVTSPYQAKFSYRY